MMFRDPRTFRVGVALFFLQFTLWIVGAIGSYRWMEPLARLVVVLFYLLSIHIAVRHVFNFQRVDGNLLIGGAYNAPVIEIDKSDKIVWKLTAEDIPEIGFAYSAGCLRLPNGNTVVAAYTSKFPIFEVTPAKKIVWKFQNPAVGNPTHVKVLTPAAVEKFLAGKGA